MSSDSANPTYLKEVAALRLLNRDWDELTRETQQALHHTFMYTMSAALDVGLIVYKTDG